LNVGNPEREQPLRGRTAEVTCPECRAPVLVVWSGRPGPSPLCPVCSSVVPLPVGNPSDELALAWIWELLSHDEPEPPRGLIATLRRWLTTLGGA
jgi:hypothetical protein